MGDDANSLLAKWLANQNTPVKNEPEVTSSNLSTSPLSSGEKRLYFLQSLQPNNPFYNYAEIYDLRGNWNLQRLMQSIQIVCENNQIFRENYTQNIDGLIEVTTPPRNLYEHKVITAQEAASKSEEDVNDLKYKFSRRAFDLSSDPLFRYIIIEHSANHLELIVTMHHIITDKWSMQNFRKQLKDAYLAEKIGNSLPPKGSYRDYAIKENQHQVDEADLNYWLNKLSTPAKELVLPHVKTRLAAPTFSGAFHNQPIPESLRLKSLEFASRNNFTLFSIFLAAYKILLSKYAGEEEISVGTPVSSRNTVEEEGLIGFFNETIALKTQIENTKSFREITQKVQQELHEAFDHKSVPFLKIVSELGVERNASQNPFFSSMFLFHKKEKDWHFGNDLIMKFRTYDLGVAKFDFTIYIEQAQDDSLILIAEYATDILEKQAAELITKQYVDLVSLLLEKPDDESKNIKIFTQKRPTYGLHSSNYVNTVVDDFLNAANKNPRKIAVSANNTTITYSELDRRSNDIANHLRQHTESKRIGLLMDRSVEAISGIFGIIKAGCSYVPIDPNYPDERIQFMLNDSGCSALLTSRSVNIDESFFDQRTIVIEDIPAHENDVNFSALADEAYMIYTSGSSGRPKGVQITHSNLWHSTQARSEFYARHPASFLLLSSFSFDSSIAGIFWTMTTGGKLVISKEKEEQEVTNLLSKIQTEKVTHSLMLPSLYSILLEFQRGEMDTLETVIVAGEACSKEVVTMHFKNLPNTTLYNEYGPTEATVWSIAHEIKKADLEKERIPIGQSIPFVNTHILNSDLETQITGISGELFLEGPLISPGYHEREDKTNQGFVSVPEISDVKLYRTGDVVVENLQGELEFIGRVDEQIKIRGFRVELSEIENKISEIASIDNAVVVYNKVKKQLKAFYISEHLIEEDLVRSQLNTTLPAHMVPASITRLESLPKLPNGKVDRKLLEAHQTQQQEIKQPEPVDEVEDKLLEIWKEVLRTDDITVSDNFFAIGGDSLLSIRINAKAKEQGIQFSTNQLFTLQTVRELANHIRHKKREEVPTAVFDRVPLSPIQHWFFQTHKAHVNHWHQIFSIPLSEQASSAHVNKAVNLLIKNHQALRTVFNLKTREQEFPLHHELYDVQQFEISGKVGKEKEQKLSSIDFTMVNKANIEEGGLFQVAQVTVAGESQLRVYLHHLICDAISIQNIAGSLHKLLNHYEESTTTNREISQYSTYVHSLLTDPDYYQQEKSFWDNQFERTPIQPTTEGNLLTEELIVDRKMSDEIRGAANHTFNTRPDELLLAAYLKTISDLTGETELTLGLENHGRNIPNLQIDVGETVGWFTSFFPRKFTTQNENLAELIIKTKDELRNTPNSGIGFGLLYWDMDKETQPTIPYTFNYLGDFGSQQTEGEQFDYIQDNARHERSQVHHCLELNCYVKNEIIHIYFRKNPNYSYLHNEISQTYVSNLATVLTACTESENRKTVSDFEVKGLEDDDLKELLKDFEL